MLLAMTHIRDSVLPYYQRSVYFTNNQTRVSISTPQYEPSAFSSSKKGLLQVSYSTYASPMASWFHKGGSEPGIPFNDGLSLEPPRFSIRTEYHQPKERASILLPGQLSKPSNSAQHHDNIPTCSRLREFRQ